MNRCTNPKVPRSSCSDTLTVHRAFPAACPCFALKKVIALIGVPCDIMRFLSRLTVVRVRRAFGVCSTPGVCSALKVGAVMAPSYVYKCRWRPANCPSHPRVSPSNRRFSLLAMVYILCSSSCALYLHRFSAWFLFQ